MAGLVPAIHTPDFESVIVDRRNKPDDDDTFSRLEMRHPGWPAFAGHDNMFV
jgi:hypothetical protein